jgi:anti-anti-sigma factor
MPPEEFAVQSARVGEGTYIVSASGELDLHTVGQLEAELTHAFDQGAQRIALDLACVTFIDSTALGAIVAAQRTLRLTDGELLVVSDDPRIARVLEITGLDRTLRIHTSLTEAVTELVHAAALS